MKLAAIGAFGAILLASCGMSQEEHSARIDKLRAQLDSEVPIGSSEETVRAWIQANQLQGNPGDREEGNIVAVGKCFSAGEWYCESWCSQVEFDLSVNGIVEGYKVTHVGDCI